MLAKEVDNAESRPDGVTAESRDRLPRSVVRWAVSLAWALNLILLAALCGWIFADGRFMEPVEVKLASPSAGPAVEPPGKSVSLAFSDTRPMTPVRMRLLTAAGWGVVATLALLFIGLFFGAPRQRRLWSWLAITAVVAAWLALWVAWPQLAWAGKRVRVGRLIDQFEPVAAALRDHWPIADDASPELGPFSAYPNGAPRIVMPLLTPAGRGNHAPFSVVERSDKGALRFELVGNDAGAWLEWHPAGSKPASFVGGLETEYELLRASPLADGWHLSRYQPTGLAGR